MSEFKGRVPEIVIRDSPAGIFTYYCKKCDKRISYPCRMNLVNRLDDCYDCMGFNLRFERLYIGKAKCRECGLKLSYGYFIMIYLLEKAGLLPKNFKMLCCLCRKKDSKD